MIPCKHCNTPNSLDSTFCKRCGTGLPEDEITTAKAKLEKVVEEGIHALNLGKLEEAMAIAEMAVLSDPSMAAGFALKASVHERKGEIAEALECAERLVELNPDSELDKIKRNQLRAALGASALANRPPSRMVAGVAAMSVAAIVLCTAVLTAKYMNRPFDTRMVSNLPLRHDPINSVIPNQTGAPDNSTGQVTPPNTGVPQQNPPTGPNVVQANPSNLGAGDVGAAQGQDDSQQSVHPRGNSSTEGTLPDGRLQIEPITPSVPNLNNTNNANSANQVSNPPKGHSTPGGDVVDAQPEGPTNKQLVQQTPPPGQNDPGEIDIRIHDNGNGASSHSKSGSQDNPKDTSKIFMKMGNDYYQMGNYSGAASSLEKAVSSGADPANANYRLAQSYNSLGKKSEAAEAYKRTIAACSSSLNSGKGNAAKLRAMRDTAETALKQLQGG